jgi:hypothetical protein
MTAKVKEVPTITIPAEVHLDGDYRAPSRYYIIDMFGDAVYFKTHSRTKAQDAADARHGKGMFSIRVVVKAEVR